MSTEFLLNSLHKTRIRNLLEWHYLQSYRSKQPFNKEESKKLIISYLDGYLETIFATEGVEKYKNLNKRTYLHLIYDESDKNKSFYVSNIYQIEGYLNTMELPTNLYDLIKKEVDKYNVSWQNERIFIRNIQTQIRKYVSAIQSKEDLEKDWPQIDFSEVFKQKRKKQKPRDGHLLNLKNLLNGIS